jgi:hypothetical protein
MDGTEAVNCDDAIRVTLPDVDIDYKSTGLRRRNPSARVSLRGQHGGVVFLRHSRHSNLDAVDALDCSDVIQETMILGTLNRNAQSIDLWIAATQSRITNSTHSEIPPNYSILISINWQIEKTRQSQFTQSTSDNDSPQTVTWTQQMHWIEVTQSRRQSSCDGITLQDNAL